MRVHIVCKDLNSDRVLPRLAKMLAEGTGWSLSERADQNADINYFFPYLNYEKTRSKSVAWFTHFDDDSSTKAQRWVQAAQAVDLRITLSPLYRETLLQDGATEFIPPAIEKQFFKQMSTYNFDNPAIGVAGWVYGDLRKGEDLIAQLVQERFCKPLRWKASGHGWPIEDTRRYEWQQMAGYYASLDVLVCASRLEGGPLPPFEALATGTKIVIPTGVGALDELPDIPGIYRFDAGDYDGLCRALEDAITATDVDQNKLREVASYYSPARWVQMHKAAIEGYFQPKPEAYVTYDDLPSGCGVYYVAFGGAARECAQAAIASWKKHMPNVPVALVSDTPLDAGEDVYIEQPDRDLGGRIAKLNVDLLVPDDWEYVLYLDADTEVVGDVSYLFQLLVDGYEFLICKDASKYASTRNMVRPDNRDEVEATWSEIGYHDLLQLNGGVFGWKRCERAQAFFEAWRSEWDRWGKRDQGALLRALYANPLRMMVLGNEWNTVTRYYPAERSAGILHYPMTARRWHSIVHPRLDSDEAMKRIIK